MLRELIYQVHPRLRVVKVPETRGPLGDQHENALSYYLYGSIRNTVLLLVLLWWK